jgi:hypothetical protein
MNKNPYDQDACKLFIEQHNIQQQLSSKYSITRQDRFIVDKSFSLGKGKQLRKTPREHMISPFVTMCSFYYLAYLIRENVDYIADIGCGMNFFKDILPIRVHGIDGVGNYDEQKLFDKSFVKNHKNFYDAAMSIDALHFIPITEFKNRIMEFYEIIKPGGRAYLAMNAARLIDCTDQNTLDSLFKNTRHQQARHLDKEINDYILAELKTLPINFLVVDCLVDEVYDEYLDGNIRLVFEK